MQTAGFYCHHCHHRESDAANLSTASGVLSCPVCGSPVQTELSAQGSLSGESPWQEQEKPAAVIVQEFLPKLRELTPRVFVTPALIALNLAVFAIMVATGVSAIDPTPESLLRWQANFGPKTSAGEWWRLLTCTFLHIGIIHLLLNMWVLWDIGFVVERLVGNTGFLVLYLLSGLAGSLASIYWNPILISAGASGAIFGVWGAFLGALLLRRDSIPLQALKRLRSSVYCAPKTGPPKGGS